MRIVVALLSSLLAVSIGAVPAGAVDRFQVGEWKGQSRYDEQSGKFSRCTIEGQFRSGITLYFGITRDYRIEIWLSNDAWRLAEGSSYNVQYRIDNGPRYGGTVAALTSTLARLDVTEDEDQVFDQLRFGARLLVSGAGEPLAFRLDGTSAGLDRLRQCVDNELRAENNGGRSGSGGQQSANPFGGSAPPPRGGAPQPRTGGGEPPLSASQIIEVIFQDPRFAEYKLLRGRERPADMQEFDEVWQAPSRTVGTVKSYASSRSSDQIMRDIAVDDKRACRGEFVNAADTAALPNGSSVTRLATACRGDDKSWFAAYTAYPVKDGSHYVIAHISFGTGVGAARADDQILDAVRDILR